MLKAGMVAAEKRWTKRVSYSRFRKCKTTRMHIINWVRVGGGKGWSVDELNTLGRYASGFNLDVE